MADSNAALNTLRAKLAEKFAQVNLELFTASGKQSFNFGIATDPIAGKIFEFWREHKRTPNLIFNDGLPDAWKPALEKQPDLLNALFSPLIWTREYSMQGEAMRDQAFSDSTGIFAFNCKMWAREGSSVTYPVLMRAGESHEWVESHTVNFAGPINSRFVFNQQYVDIPRSSFTGGAFQTWGLLLVAMDRPDFVYATDEGFFLTMDGVAMIERSLQYWLYRAIPEIQMLGDAEIFAHLGQGPVLRGIPVSLVEKFRAMLTAQKKANQPLLQIAKWIVSFVGLYFGGAAVNGLLAGSFTIPNLTGTLNIASKFGIDTGEVSTGLKLLGTLTGDPNILQNAIASSTGAPSMSQELFEEFGDFGPVEDYGWDFGYDFAEFDVGPIDTSSLSSSEFYAMLDSDSFALEESGDLAISQEAFSEALGEWGPPPSGYDAGQILRENEEALSHAMEGPVSAVQYMQAAGSSPQVTAATQVAMKATGTSPTSTTITPAQAQRAAQFAAQQSQSTSDWIWTQVKRGLEFYGRYQQIQRQQGKSLPYGGSQYPGSSPGSVSRQPDGSITMRRPDGSLTTVRPDGSVVQTAPGGGLPAALGINKTVLIAAGLGIAGLALILTGKDKR